MKGLGRNVYGIAAIGLGLVGLWWGDFATVWQPVPNELSGRTALAYAAALAFIVAGVALQWRRSLWVGTVVVVILYSIFAFLWLRRVIGFPQIMGTWAGLAEQIALVVGGIVALATAQSHNASLTAISVQAGRLVFGLCLLSFGFEHFSALPQTAAMVPKWLPPGQQTWALATGVADILAGLALLSNIATLLAARLLTAMFVGFGLLVWAPQIALHPAAHVVWAGNAINLALIGAAWVVADSLRAFPKTPAVLDEDR
jgi:uncharacterized membrane protein YphA (DoxX/SURF4 family)